MERFYFFQQSQGLLFAINPVAINIPQWDLWHIQKAYSKGNDLIESTIKDATGS